MNKVMKLLNDVIRFIQYGDLPTSYYQKRGMVVGKCLNRQSNTKFDPAHCWLITIGDYVTISNRVIFLAHDDSTRIHMGVGKVGTIKVGDRTFIGAGTVILPGVNIGKDVIIGAGSVVTNDIENGCIAVGNPAKVIGNVKEYVKKNSELMSKGVFFDNSYAYHSITDAKKREMCDKLNDKIGFLKLKDFEQFR